MSRTSMSDYNNRPSPSPILLSELLIQVFSYLDQRTLLFSVQYVCRLWYRVTSLLLDSTVGWHPDLIYNEEAKERFMVQLCKATTLIYLPMQHPDGQPQRHPETWAWLFNQLAHTVSRGELRIREVRIKGALDMESRILPFLKTIGVRLTTLTIESMEQFPVPLQTILELCPQLERLGLYSSHPLLQMNGLPKRGPFRLQSIVLGGLMVEESSFLRFLRQCPHLEELRLQAMYRPWIEESVPLSGFMSIHDLLFLKRLEQVVPRVTKLELTSHEMGVRLPLTTMGAMALAFTNVQDLSIAYRDIAGQGLHILDPDRDRLTSLRITGWTGHTPLLVQTVHEYLLKAKHLLEFRGLHVHFHLPMMDLEGRLTGASVTNDLQETIEVYYPRYAPQRRTVWACRQLEVLSLTVDETWTHPNRARYMRTLFGYLVRVCPNLKQLHIRRRLVRLDYWSGLCLLTRLKHLRRLDVECQELVVVVSAKEEGVVRKTPKLCRAKTVFNRCMRLVQPSLRYDPSEDRPPLAAFGSWPGEPRAGEPGFGIVDGIDMSQLGRRQDVKDHVRERARVDAPIWPDLELLQIRYTYGQLDGLEKAVQACKTGIRTELIREDWVE